MKTITREQLDAICSNGEAIDHKAGYPAVVIHPDDTITKFWARRKGFFSSTRFSPYATRFVKNAEKLAQRGIKAPQILDHAVLENSHVRIVTYRSLPGKSIRDLLKNSPSEVDIPDLCRYIHLLHEKGIEFRASHMGNFIKLPEGGYGIIDFTDVRFSSKPISLSRRGTNIATLLRYLDDVKLLDDAGHPGILECYLEILNPDEKAKRDFMAGVNSHLG